MKALAGFMVITLVVVFASYGRAIDLNDPSLVAYYPLDEGEGIVAADASGEGNDGTVVGNAAWVDGKYGKALEFDKGEDYFEVENSEAFGLEKVSVTFWMYPYVAGASGGGSCIVVSNIVKAASLDWGFEWWNGGTFDWTLWPIGDKKTRTTVIEVKRWIFVAGTYDGTTTGIYIDGELKASNKFPGLSNPGPRPFYVAGNTCGVGWGCTSGYYNGIIDEVTVFKRGLSKNEVIEIMNGALSGASVKPYGKLTTTWGKLKSIQ